MNRVSPAAPADSVGSAQPVAADAAAPLGPRPAAAGDWSAIRRARRNRNFATLVALLVLVAVVFGITVTRIRQGIDTRLAREAAAAAAAPSAAPAPASPAPASPAAAP